MNKLVNLESHQYAVKDCVYFRRNKEKHGILSNMYSTPLTVNGYNIRTSEALYQACKFPHRPDVQREIFEQRSPMQAKWKARACQDIRSDWEEVKLDVMLWCLRVKLVQSTAFADELAETDPAPIVEYSKKDSFWGADMKGDKFVGVNVLGQLLSHVRAELLTDMYSVVEPLYIPSFVILDEHIKEVKGPTSFYYKKERVKQNEFIF